METLIFIIFCAISVLILASAVMVVTVKNIIHAALWLIATFFSIGALYILMEAEFVGVVQVLIYVGAISILILFAIMLTRHVTGEGVRQMYERWWVALIVVGALFFLLIMPTVSSYDWRTVPPPAPDQPARISSVLELGQALMGAYLLPFEIASVLLLVALVGAIVIAFEERSARRRVLTLAEELARRQRQSQPPPDAAPGAPEAQNSPAP